MIFFEYATRSFWDPAGMGEFLFKGMLYVDRLDNDANTKAREMFFASEADFLPLLGMFAMLCTAITLARQGNTYKTNFKIFYYLSQTLELTH